MPTDSPDDDEFDRQLRALTGGAAGQARFAEPSAAQRARRTRRRRDSRLAKELREPVLMPGQARPLAARRTAAQRWSRSGVAGFLRRHQSWVFVILILAALVATSIGLSWLSTH
jgi:Flp pilus assembly protein TadB